jgi:hypothetical protein
VITAPNLHNDYRDFILNNILFTNTFKDYGIYRN